MLKTRSNCLEISPVRRLSLGLMNQSKSTRAKEGYKKTTQTIGIWTICRDKKSTNYTKKSLNPEMLTGYNRFTNCKWQQHCIAGLLWLAPAPMVSALAFSSLVLVISQPCASVTCVQPDLSSCFRYFALIAWVELFTIRAIPIATIKFFFICCSLLNTYTWGAPRRPATHVLYPKGA